MKNYFNFRKFEDKLLLTNEAGNHIFLTQKEFESLLRDDIDYESNLGQELIAKNFIYDGGKQNFLESYVNNLRLTKSHLLKGTSLHIFVLTNLCNLQCVYCQAQTIDNMQYGSMSEAVAEKAVDFAFQSSCKNLTFEFQGGEPLVNFDVLKHIVKYAEANKGDRNIEYSLVSNLILLDDEKLEFIRNNNIGISTSLDGDERVHNGNRPFKDSGNTYQVVSEKIKKVQDAGLYVGAIQTTTQNSLLHAKEIVKAYIQAGLDRIFIRPLTPLGCASDRWSEIGYTPEDFLKFYKQALEYIIDINKAGTRLVEGHAAILLKRILDVCGEDYMELRSPCGGVIGQIAYYYDGNIYTCDEGRMLSEMGNDAFKLGNVFESNYNDIVCSNRCKAIMSASFLEAIPECCDCVYHPYCGTCPVLNLALEHDIYPRSTNNYKCKIYKGMLDILFQYLYAKDTEVINIFMSWIH